MPPIARSIPYAWPRDTRQDEALSSDRVALIVVAVQPSYLATTLDAEAVAFRIGLAARALHQTGALVVRVTITEPVLAGRERETHGDAVVSLIERFADATFAAVALDAFDGTGLDLALRRLGRDRVALCGLGAESAIERTRETASRLGFECLTLVDAVAPHSRSDAARVHSQVMTAGGALGAIGRTPDLVAALSA